MAGYIFLGRQRHPLKILLFQLLTLGIYGRVYLYKILREFDGHEALFLDRRPYIPLLILPFVGPLLVKQKVTAIASDLIHHDVTTPRFKPGRLRLLAWVPLVPLFHMELQRVLNHHWGMHRKELELELKRAQLVSLQRSRTPEAVKATQALSKEIAQREKELDDVRQASLALREAEQVRLEAERAAGRRATPMALVRKLSAAAAARLPRRGAGGAVESEEAVETLPETPEPEPVGRGKGVVSEPEPGPEPEPEAPEEAPIEEAVEGSEPEEAPKPKKPKAEPVEDAASAKKGWTSFVPFFGKKKDKEPAEPEPKKSKKGMAKGADRKAAEEEPSKKEAKKEKDEKKGGVLSFLPFMGKKPEAKGGKASKPGKGGKAELSRADRKALKQKEKEKAKAAKQAAKEKKKADKAAAKEAKQAEKAAAKEAKAKEKAQKKAAKDQAKAEAAAAKKKEQAAEKKKGKAKDKKEKPSPKESGKSKGAKPKSRSK